MDQKTPCAPPNRSHRPKLYGQLSSLASPTVIPSTSNALPSQRNNQGCLNPHNRRLILRNAGFRGALLPGRTMSPILRALSQTSETSNPVFDEHSQGSWEGQTLHDENTASSSVGVQRQISSSTRQTHQSPRPSFGDILPDSTATDTADKESIESWYNKKSNSSSPFLRKSTPENRMKLREMSLNGKTLPTVSTPSLKSSKGRQNRRSNSRSNILDASSHIEYLESQLATMNAKLDALTSPTTKKAHSAKLRALTTENRSLLRDLSNWESKFSERVKDDIDKRLKIEADLRSRVRTLEQEVAAKDRRIQEFEWEKDSLLKKAKDIDALKADNQDLEKRIYSLTQLLAQSPAKPGICSEMSSAEKGDHSNKAAKRRSTMPRIPPSPGGVRLSMNAATDSDFWSSSNFEKFSSIEQRSDLPHYRIPARHTSQPDTLSGSVRSDSGSTGSGVSLYGSPQAFSRPTSLFSNGSRTAGIWGLPMPASLDTNRQRKMRRFVSGRCALKPLILPAAVSSIEGEFGADPREQDDYPANGLRQGQQDLMTELAQVEESLEERCEDEYSHIETTPSDAHETAAELPASPPKPATALPCNNCISGSSLGRKLRLWLRFSLAVVFAIGTAIKDGPETLLVDCGRPPYEEQDENSWWNRFQTRLLSLYDYLG